MLSMVRIDLSKIKMSRKRIDTVPQKTDIWKIYICQQEIHLHMVNVSIVMLFFGECFTWQIHRFWASLRGYPGTSPRARLSWKMLWIPTI